MTADEVIGFATDAVDEGVTQATVSGGDPLFHPEIVPALSGLRDLGLRVKLDTVGTAFLEAAPIVYKGRGTAEKVDVTDVAPHVDFVNIPLDGATQNTITNFRRGRANLLNETRAIAALLRSAGVTFGFNTVANARNVHELEAIRDIAEEEQAAEWQVFEYDSDGPNPSSKKPALRLGQGQFEAATRNLVSTSGNLKVVCKSLDTRSGAYFLIDDSGLAWKPAGEGLRQIMGHITTDRDQVIAALRRHIQQLT